MNLDMFGLPEWLFFALVLFAFLFVFFVLRRQQVAVHNFQLSLSALQGDKNVLQEKADSLSEQLRITSDDLLEYREHCNDLNMQNARLDASLKERDRAIQQQREQFDLQKTALQTEFENLANRIFDEKGKVFAQNSQSSIEGMLKPFREQITEFRTRVDGIHKENNESKGSLQKELESLRGLNQRISEDAQNLTTALKGDKKALGNWGEVQLEKSLQLAGLIKDQHYQTQMHLKDEAGKSYYPDFIINLPDEQHLVVDSKASLLAYQAAVSADSDEQREEAMSHYVQALRNHVKDLSEKNYSRLKGLNSPSFVLMFLPLEAAYIEGLRYCPELYDEAYRKNIILVSHMTLLPVLKTISNIWRMKNSQDDALALSEKAGDIYNQVCLLAERMQRLGGTLLTANKHYNGVLVALLGQQGLHSKVERFRSASIEANKQMPSLEALHADLELDRLDVVLASKDEEL